MFWIFTNHSYDTFALDYLAIITHLFNRWSNLHGYSCIFLHSSITVWHSFSRGTTMYCPTNPWVISAT